MGIGKRVDYLAFEELSIFKIKSTLGSTIISICAIIILFLIIDSYWIFVPFIIYLFFERFGYSDFIFDEKNNLFRKRYGIFKYYLGDTYRFEGLTDMQIKAVKAYETSIGKIASFDQLFIINLFYKDKKVPIYSSQDLKFIRVLFNKISLVKGIKAVWEIEVEEG